MADKYYLRQHIKKLCEKNLHNSRVRYCATCAFEDEIVEERPDLKLLFELKRRSIEIGKEESKKQIKLKFK